MNSWSDEIVLILNGREHRIRDVSPTARLAGWLRKSGYTGIQTGCGQGHCGCCTVLVSEFDAVRNRVVHNTINSCLARVVSMNGKQITTIESIGNRRKGYHDVQKRLAAANGTQCGFCTPGFVTQMYGLLLNNPRIDHRTIENGFAGNLCRCTGYRSILTAMQSFSQCDNDCNDGCCPTKKPQHLDAHNIRALEKNINVSEKLTSFIRVPVHIKPDWFQATTLRDVFHIIDQRHDCNFALTVGNTSPGFNKWNRTDKRKVIAVDISQVYELLQMGFSEEDDGIIIGGAVTLTNVLGFLKQHRKNPAYLELAKLIEKLANIQLRNAASWSGNLVAANVNSDFTSDLVPALSAMNAFVTILSSKEKESKLFMAEFMDATLISTDIIKEIFIPRLDDSYLFKTYKVTPRPQNREAIVNAAFCIQLNDQRLVQDSQIAFGGVTGDLFRPTDIGKQLLGAPLTSHTLKKALNILSEAVEKCPPLPEKRTALASTEYRHRLTLSLFYKFFLFAQDTLPPSLECGTNSLVRPTSSGVQTFDEPEQKLFPVNHPVHKIEGLPQTAGEVQYTRDVPNIESGLHAAHVLATQATGIIKSIDESMALKAPGVIAFIGIKDLESLGGNNDIGDPGDQTLFLGVGMTVQYYGQIIGMIVAEKQSLARKAARLVKVAYESNGEAPITTAEEAYEKKSFFDIHDPSFPYKFPKGGYIRGDIEKGFSECKHVLAGKVKTTPQEHFYMETQSTNVVPIEHTLHITSSTQSAGKVRDFVAFVTGLSGKDINVIQQRLGGAFGGKQTDAPQLAGQCAIASLTLNRAVRCHMNRAEDMLTTGKREGLYAKYKIGFNDQGKIIALDLEYFVDAGSVLGISVYLSAYACMFSDVVYGIPNMRANAKILKTNRATNAYMRGPGMAVAMFVTESAIDHVAAHLKMDPALVRSLNFHQENSMTLFQAEDIPYKKMCFPWRIREVDSESIRRVWGQLLEQIDHAQRLRAIKDFNAKNKWKKRGLSINPCRFIMDYRFHNHKCDVGINNFDGTVIVSHSGCEMGQGINTKVAQAVSFGLGVPIENIQFEHSSTNRHPSAGFTGTSTTSEVCVKAANKACEQLTERLAEIKKENPDAPFNTLIRRAYKKGINLSATGWNAFEKTNYDSISAACSVVELDVLTGEHQILSCDIVFDCGKSINQFVDTGQIEGAFVQGLGLFQLEEILYQKDGKMVNPTPWTYSLPDSHSIPINWNISFLKNSQHEKTVYGAKATGEPSLILAMSVTFALRAAIRDFHEELDKKDIPVPYTAPFTVEKSHLACSVEIEDMILDGI